MTGNFCDGGITVAHDQCFASDRYPQLYIDNGKLGRQRTPLCTFCEESFKFCRCCRGVKGCTPPTRKTHWSTYDKKTTKPSTGPAASATDASGKTVPLDEDGDGEVVDPGGEPHMRFHFEAESRLEAAVGRKETVVVPMTEAEVEPSSISGQKGGCAAL